MAPPTDWKALYPFPSHWLDRAGLRYHYLDQGQGDPVLMLHGNPTWSFYYRNLVLGLQDRWRTIVPDHIGCGLSDKPDDARYAYTLDQRVDDLEQLVDHLQLSPLTLVLHDWGGMIGMAFAQRHPDRIARIVLLNTGAFPLPPAKPLPWQIRISRWPGIGALLIRGCNAFSRGAVSQCVTRRPLSPAAAAGLLAPYDSWGHRRAVHRFIQDIPLEPGERAWDTVTRTAAALPTFRDRPALICWGDRDFVFDHHFLERWQREWPQAKVHRFADAGHYVLEDAHEQIVPLVRGFLEEHPLAPESPAP